MNKAHEALRACARVYAKCSSYSDNGAVRYPVVNKQGETAWEDEVRFRTAFVRDGVFRFKFWRRPCGAQKPDRTLVWFDGTEAKWWWTLQPEKIDISDLGFAVASATGVSQGSAHIIPRMLLPRLVRGRNICQPFNLTPLEDSEIDESACLRIGFKKTYEYIPCQEELAWYEEHQRPLPPPTGQIDEIYWIDRATFVLRRIDDIKDGAIDERTDFYPSLNQPIPDSALVFDPDLQ